MQVALFGLVFLGDAVTPIMAAAILIATTGVVTMALKPGTSADLNSTLLGLGAGAMFALSAVGFRGAILSLGLPSYVVAATFTVVVGLMLQSVLLSIYLWLRNPEVLVSIVRAAIAVCGVCGRAGLPILVPRLRARDRRQRAHAGAGRGAVRAGDLAFCVQAADDGTRSCRRRADRDRGGTAAVGGVSGANVAPTRRDGNRTIDVREEMRRPVQGQVG